MSVPAPQRVTLLSSSTTVVGHPPRTQAEGEPQARISPPRPVASTDTIQGLASNPVEMMPSAPSNDTKVAPGFLPELSQPSADNAPPKSKSSRNKIFFCGKISENPTPHKTKTSSNATSKKKLLFKKKLPLMKYKIKEPASANTLTWNFGKGDTEEDVSSTDKTDNGSASTKTSADTGTTKSSPKRKRERGPRRKIECSIYGCTKWAFRAGGTCINHSNGEHIRCAGYRCRKYVSKSKGLYCREHAYLVLTCKERAEFAEDMSKKATANSLSADDIEQEDKVKDNESGSVIQQDPPISTKDIFKKAVANSLSDMVKENEGSSTQQPFLNTTEKNGLSLLCSAVAFTNNCDAKMNKGTSNSPVAYYEGGQGNSERVVGQGERNSHSHLANTSDNVEHNELGVPIQNTNDSTFAALVKAKMTASLTRKLMLRGLGTLPPMEGTLQNSHPAAAAIHTNSPLDVMESVAGSGMNSQNGILLESRNNQSCNEAQRSISTLQLTSKATNANDISTTALPANEHPNTNIIDAAKKRKRPYNRYNVYFIFERARLIKSLGSDPNANEPPSSLPRHVEPGFEPLVFPPLPTRFRDVQMHPDWYIPWRKKEKRVHRKTHGVSSFADLAKNIAASWKVVDDETMAWCEAVEKVSF